MRFTLLVLLLLTPSSTAAHAQCAPDIRKLLVTRQLSVAQTALDAQLAQNRTDDRALHCLALIALERDDPDAAIKLLERAVATHPKNPDHHVRLGLALRVQGSRVSRLRAPSIIGRMKTELELALTLDSTQVEAIYTLLLYYAQVPEVFGGSIVTAKAHANALRRLDPMRAQLGMAYIAEQEKRLDDAEREYRAVTVAQPDSDAAWAAAGAFFRRQKRWADAVSMHEQQVRAVPSDAPRSREASAHYALGLALERAGKRDAAVASYRRALAANPDHADAKKALGRSR